MPDDRIRKFRDSYKVIRDNLLAHSIELSDIPQPRLMELEEVLAACNEATTWACHLIQNALLDLNENFQTKKKWSSKLWTHASAGLIQAYKSKDARHL